MIRLSLSLFALTAAGCVSNLEQQERRESPSFQAGYGDGCVTAGERQKSFSNKNTRDPYAFDNDDAYRAGWRQGYLECESKIPDRNDGGRVLGDEDDF